MMILAVAIAFVLILAGFAAAAFVVAALFFAIGLGIQLVTTSKRAISPDLPSVSATPVHQLKRKTGDIARFGPVDDRGAA